MSQPLATNMRPLILFILISFALLAAEAFQLCAHFVRKSAHMPLRASKAVQRIPLLCTIAPDNDPRAGSEHQKPVSPKGQDSMYYIEEREPHSGIKLCAARNDANLLKYLHGKGVAQHNRDAFDFVMEQYEEYCQHMGGTVPIVLDSCCGTGRSTQIIAQHRPGMFVIGMDKSVSRLARTRAYRSPDQDAAQNVVLVRANCIDMWELLWKSGVEVREHFLLYPNPYPKPTQLASRWHGSPAFPLLLNLGGRLEVRASWRTYLEELSIAAQHLLHLRAGGDRSADSEAAAATPPGTASALTDGIQLTNFTQPLPMHSASSDACGVPGAMTNFEAKYFQAGLTLHRLVLPDLPRAPCP